MPTKKKATLKTKSARSEKLSRARKTSRKRKIVQAKQATAGEKTARARKRTAPKKSTRRKKLMRRARVSAFGSGTSVAAINFSDVEERGFGSDAAGQSGDTQGLSRLADADSESVEDLVEEGQAFEAEVISGVERASLPDEGDITISEAPEDDVPPRYRGR